MTETVTGDQERTRRLAAGFVAFVVGQLVGDKAVTVAKGILWVIDRKQLHNPDEVANATLLVIVILAAVSGVAGGVLAVWKKWVYAEALGLAVVVGLVTAAFVILDYGLAATTDGSGLVAGQASYFLFWVIGLWLLPAVVLPKHNRSTEGKVLVGYGMFTVVAGMTLVGVASGIILELAVCKAEQWWIPEQAISWCSYERRWVARPVSINAICGALVVVACAPMWWHESKWSTRTAWTWTVAATAMAATYSGLWGAYLYRAGRFAEWRHADNFGALPVAGVLAVVLVYAATRGESGAVAVGWSVTRWFWRLLPLAFAVICAINAMILLAPIEKYEGEQWWILAVMHGFNGLVIGWSLMLTVRLFELMCRMVPGE